MSRSGAHYAWHGKPKIRHQSEASAEQHAAELRLIHPFDVMSVYDCWCGGYHVGHEKKSKNRRWNPHDERIVGRLIGVLRGTYKYEVTTAASTDRKPSDTSQNAPKSNLLRRIQ